MALLDNLPAYISALSGRGELIAEIQRHFIEEMGCSPKLLVLRGGPGIGKTSLAIWLAQLHERRLWVRADGTDVRESFAALGCYLGLRAAGGLDYQVDQVRTAIESQPGMLLVFDGVEVPSVLRRCLPRQGAVKVLITTRGEIDLAPGWEVIVHHVPVLSEEVSLAYLMSKARIAQRVHSSNEEHQALLHICTKLGGLPIALEITRSILMRPHASAVELLGDMRRVGALTRISRRDGALEEMLRVAVGTLDDRLPCAVLEIAGWFWGEEVPLEWLAEAVEGYAPQLALRWGDDEAERASQMRSAIWALDDLGLVQYDNAQQPTFHALVRELGIAMSGSAGKATATAVLKRHQHQEPEAAALLRRLDALPHPPAESPDEALRDTRVFLSYSHDGEVHRDGVQGLADALLKSGFDVWVDFYQRPPEQGWSRWAREGIQRASYVIVVCTAPLVARFSADAAPLQDKRERGITWEAEIIELATYRRRLQPKQLIALFPQWSGCTVARAAPDFIRFSFHYPADHRRLIQHLRDAPERAPP